MKVHRNHSGPPEGDLPTQILSGWKEIANYMGKGVRTVQRYEMQFGLPVRRPAGKPRGSVVATRSEIDSWVADSPIRETFELSKAPDFLASTPAPTTSLRQAIAQLTGLHEEMTELRADLKRSVHNLQENLQSVMRQQGREIEASSRLTVIDQEFRTPQMLELLRHGAGDRKIS